MSRAPLALVVAVSRNGVIGRAGKLPWHLPEDLRHFRRLTLDHAVIMGRQTYESIGKALPRRRNIVLTRQPAWSAPGCERANSLEQALQLARQRDPEPRVIGGSALFEASLPHATRIYYTRVEREVEGDTFFPPLDPSQWREVEARPGDGVTYLILERQPE